MVNIRKNFKAPHYLPFCERIPSQLVIITVFPCPLDTHGEHGICSGAKYKPGGDPTKVDLLVFARTAGINAAPPPPPPPYHTNVDFHKCRHIQMSPYLSGYIHPQSHNSLVKSVSMIIKNHSNTYNYGKTITELIQEFTERGMALCTWNGRTFIVDQNVSVDNVLSYPHRNNGVSKVLDILLSNFVSRGWEHSLWCHHGHENKQLKSAQCQYKANAVSGRHICTVWHSAGISGKCRDIGIDFSGIAAKSACRLD